MKIPLTKKIICCALALGLLLCSAACGKKQDTDTTPVQDGSVVQAVTQEPLGQGFTLNHAVAAGFGLGSDTLEDAKLRFGEPTAVDTQEYTALTIVTADYPFGQLIFNGTKGGTPVLTSVSISSQHEAPMGIAIGDSIDSAVETVYTGSAAMLGGNYEQSLSFYGDSLGAPSGTFTWLTAEFTTTATTARYSAEYVAEGFEEGMIAKLTLYFNTDGQLVNYTLLYIAG